LKIINIESKHLSKAATRFAIDVNAFAYMDALNATMIYHSNNDVNSVRFGSFKKSKLESYILGFFHEYLNTMYKTSGSDSTTLEGEFNMFFGNIRDYISASRTDVRRVEKFHTIQNDIAHDILTLVPKAEVDEIDGVYADMMGACFNEISKYFDETGKYIHLGEEGWYAINTENINMEDPRTAGIVDGIKRCVPISISIPDLINSSLHDFRPFRPERPPAIERTDPKSGLLSMSDFVSHIGNARPSQEGWVFFDSNIIPKGYSYFLAPKKGYKSLRLITAPNVELKYIQAKINRVMQVTHLFDDSIVAYKPGADHVKYLKDSRLAYDSMLSVDFSNYFSEIRGSKLHTALGEYLFPDSKNELYSLALKVSEAIKNRLTLSLPDYKACLIAMNLEIDSVMQKLDYELAMCKNIGLEPLVLEPCQDIVVQFEDLDELYLALAENRPNHLRSRLRLMFVRSNQDQVFNFMTKLIAILKIQRLLLMKRSWYMLKSAVRLAQTDSDKPSIGNSLLNFMFKAIVEHNLYFKINDLHTAVPDLRLMGDDSTIRSYSGSFNKRALFKVIESKLGTEFKLNLQQPVRYGRGGFDVLTSVQYDNLVKILTCNIPSASGYEKFIKTKQVVKTDLDEVFGFDTGEGGTIVGTAKKFKKCPAYYKTLGLFSKDNGNKHKVFKALPQGGPTSGTVANLLNEKILSHLKKELPEVDYRICIYSDNVYVFFNKGTLSGIDATTGKKETARPVKYIIRDKVEKVCSELSIRLNPSKINIYEDADRKVLGTISDTKGDIRLSRRKMYELNQIIINLNKKPTINYKGKVYTRTDMASYLGKLNWFKRVTAGSPYQRKLIMPNW